MLMIVAVAVCIARGRSAHTAADCSGAQIDHVCLCVVPKSLNFELIREKIERRQFVNDERRDWAEAGSASTIPKRG